MSAQRQLKAVHLVAGEFRSGPISLPRPKITQKSKLLVIYSDFIGIGLATSANNLQLSQLILIQIFLNPDCCTFFWLSHTLHHNSGPNTNKMVQKKSQVCHKHSCSDLTNFWVHLGKLPLFPGPLISLQLLVIYHIISIIVKQDCIHQLIIKKCKM